MSDESRISSHTSAAAPRHDSQSGSSRGDTASVESRILLGHSNVDKHIRMQGLRLPWMSTVPLIPAYDQVMPAGHPFRPACILGAASLRDASYNMSAFALYHGIPADALPMVLGGRVIFRPLVSGDKGQPIEPSESAECIACAAAINRFSGDWPRSTAAWHGITGPPDRGPQYLAQARATRTAQWWQDRLARILVVNVAHELQYVQHVSPDLAGPLHRFGCWQSSC